jgi:hypothetical protein
MTAILLGMLAGCAHAPPPGGTYPQAALALRDQAYDLDSHPPDPMHQDAVRALRQLAAAVAQLPGNHSDAVARIEARADRIAHSGPDALHSDVTKEALLIALDEIKHIPRRSRALKPAEREARDAVQQIDENVAYLEQRNEIDRAFNRVATTVMIATLPVHQARR